MPGPVEARLRAIVESIVPDRAADYLCFARELLRSLRRGGPVLQFSSGPVAEPGAGSTFGKRPSSLPSPCPATRPPGRLTTSAIPTPRPLAFVGFSSDTKRVVTKWFSRGLSGRLLWAIGRELLAASGPRGRGVTHA
jgi:hypothetical protein